MQFPEHQIVPPGTIGLADLKTRRKEANDEVEAAEYYAKRDQLGIMMAQSFSLDEMPMAVLQALLDVLEINGIDRLAAIANIEVLVKFQRKVTENKASLLERKA